MLTIRLSRVGKKKQPEYRLVISEKTKDPWGDVLEYLGHYNPLANPAAINLKVDRIKHWLSKGAQVSDTVKNILIDQKILESAMKQSLHYYLPKLNEPTAQDFRLKPLRIAIWQTNQHKLAMEAISDT